MFTMKNVEKARKLRFLFDIYDMDGDGLISNSELYTVSEQSRIEVCLDSRFLDQDVWYKQWKVQMVVSKNLPCVVPRVIRLS